MHKTFYLGLTLVIVGVVAGTLIIDRGISSFVDRVAISTNESQAGWTDFAGGAVQPCQIYTCEAKSGCSIDGSQFANKGDIYRVYDKSKSQFYPPKAFTDLMKSLGYGDPKDQAVCPGSFANSFACSTSMIKNKSNDTNRSLQNAFRGVLAGTSVSKVCYASKDDKNAPTPTPTVPPVKPTPVPGNQIIFACKNWKCWYNAWNDPKLPLGTESDPFFVDDTATMNLFNVAASDPNGSIGFFHFLERRAGTSDAKSTKVCFFIPNPPPPGNTKTVCQYL